jgi:hypothetical protein
MEPLCIFLLVVIALSAMSETSTEVDVILSSGLKDWDASQLFDQYNRYSIYSQMEIITASSILVYNIDEDGNLDTYKTLDLNITAEKYQTMVQQLGLKALPCLYCDATTDMGYCKNLSNRLDKMYSHQDEFISDTIQRALLYNWTGYIVDMEPDFLLNWTRLSLFIVDWALQLKIINRDLYVWIGGNTDYNESLFSSYNFTNDNIKLLSMDTYVMDYESFVEMASQEITTVSSVDRIGFGLLTSDFIPEEDMAKITTWTRKTGATALSIWSDKIPGEWYNSLHDYLNT